MQGAGGFIQNAYGNALDSDVINRLNYYNGQLNDPYGSLFHHHHVLNVDEPVVAAVPAVVSKAVTNTATPIANVVQLPYNYGWGAPGYGPFSDAQKSAQ